MRMAPSYLAIAAAIGLSTLGTGANAQQPVGEWDVTVMSTTPDDVIVRASRMPENTPIALAGTLTQKNGSSLVLTRTAGTPAAYIPEKVNWSTNDSNAIAQGIPVGSSVMVYGKLHKSANGPTRVEADAIYDESNGRMYFLNGAVGIASNSAPRHVVTDKTAKEFLKTYQPME